MSSRSHNLRALVSGVVTLVLALAVSVAGVTSATHTGLSPLVTVPLGVLVMLVGSAVWLIVRWRHTTRVGKAPVVDRQETPSNSLHERSNIS